ncbi:MAG: 1A family penicillin-binding protein [Parcubacteria group bacterium Athens1014_26]|nr:MAG: 1A family penicillin-binding protein [Parcubacteria group bacterium Athens1014_26]
MNTKTKTIFKKISKIFSFILFAFLLIAAAGLIFFAFSLKDLPDPKQLDNRKIIQSTKVYDRTGKILLYEIHGEEKRTVLPFAEIPERVKQATLAIEDASFYNHPAFDWKSIVRAVTANLLKGEVVQGGSTITQQLAKNAFLTREKTVARKIKELIVAIELEKLYTKDEILGLYINQIPYGGNAYGIEAASQVFFKKSAKDLTLPETALLAAIAQAPSYYSPYGSHLKESLERKDYVLDQMTSLGFISEAEKIKAQKIKLKFAPRANGLKAPHFVLAVQDYLNNKYGEDYITTAGLNVITTLDWNLQQLAEKTVKDGAERNRELYKGYNAALVSEDATTGQVLAMVGSKDYFAAPEPTGCTPGKDCRFEGNFNVAVQGLRQPGSAMKPFVYVTAFEKGYSPDTMIFDLPTEFAPNNPNCPIVVDFSNNNDQCFHPHNFDGYFRGPVNLRNGLAQSINIPSVKTLYLAGIDNTLKTAKDFGITTLTERSRYGLSLVLGGGEVTLMDLTNAYSVFAQEGISRRQSMILSITDSQNNILEKYTDNPQQVIDPQYPRLINDILSDVNARSALFSASLPLTIFPGHEVALKTGTTNDYRDAWAMGYTPNLIVGVWAGNNNNTAMEKQGGSILAAVPIWSAFMKEALKDKPLTTFTKPDPVFSNKTMLRGDYIVNYQTSDKTYPQVHDILFYIDKNNPQGPTPQNPQDDPQFNNWEQPVLLWARNNIPNFDATYNQLPPGGNISELETKNYQPNINWISPQKGAFIKQNSNINIQADIETVFDINKIEIYFNNNLISSQSVNPVKKYALNYNFSPASIDLQNSLKIKVFDVLGNTKESSLILFK